MKMIFIIIVLLHSSAFGNFCNSKWVDSLTNQKSMPNASIQLTHHDQELLNHVVNNDPLYTGHYLSGFNTARARRILSCACANSCTKNDVSQKKSLRTLLQTKTAQDNDGKCRKSLEFLQELLQEAKEIDQKTKTLAKDYQFYRTVAQKISYLYSQMNIFYNQMKKH